MSIAAYLQSFPPSSKDSVLFWSVTETADEMKIRPSPDIPNQLGIAGLEPRQLQVTFLYPQFIEQGISVSLADDALVCEKVTKSAKTAELAKRIFHANTLKCMLKGAMLNYRQMGATAVHYPIGGVPSKFSAFPLAYNQNNNTFHPIDDDHKFWIAASAMPQEDHMHNVALKVAPLFPATTVETWTMTFYVWM